MTHPVLAEYLSAAEAVTAIDLTYSDLVRELVRAERRVDFYVDAADALEDAALEDAAAAAELRNLEKDVARWIETSDRIGAALPQCESRNAFRQLKALCPRFSF